MYTVLLYKKSSSELKNSYKKTNCQKYAVDIFELYLIDLTTQEELVEKDVATGLYSFMLVAIGKRRSLHLMYDLAKRCPQNIKRF